MREQQPGEARGGQEGVREEEVVRAVEGAVGGGTDVEEGDDGARQEVDTRVDVALVLGFNGTRCM